MAETAKPWDRQPAETQEDFDLFSLYMIKRNVTDVARLYFGEDGRATEGTVVAGRSYCQRIKKDNNWEGRCAAYDRWVGKQRDQVTATIIKRQASLMARQQLVIINDLYGKYKKSSKLLGERLDHELEKKATSDKDSYIGALNMLASAGKIILGEMEKVVKAHPLEEVVDNNQSMEVQDAKDKLMTLIDNRDKKKELGDDSQEAAS